MHRLYTNSTEAGRTTWKAHTVQTWEEAFLFCRRHANLKGGRNNRHQPCLCLPTEPYCPLCPSHLLISPCRYNVLYRDTQRLHLIALQSLCTMANSACVSVHKTETEDVGRSENMRAQAQQVKSFTKEVKAFHKTRRKDATDR